jgi:hypothetical protein
MYCLLFVCCVCKDKRHTVLTICNRDVYFLGFIDLLFIIIYTSYIPHSLTEPFLIVDMCVVELRCRVHRATARALGHGWERNWGPPVIIASSRVSLVLALPPQLNEWLTMNGGYAVTSFTYLLPFHASPPQRWYPWNCLLIRIQLHLFSKFRLIKFNLRCPSWTMNVCANKDTGSLWRRQSQRSLNTLTRFYFPSHSLNVSAPTGHLLVRFTIRYFFSPLKISKKYLIVYLTWRWPVDAETCSE